MTHRQLIALLRLDEAPANELPECELDPTTMRQLQRKGLVEHRPYLMKWSLTPEGEVRAGRGLRAAGRASR